MRAKGFLATRGFAPRAPCAGNRRRCGFKGVCCVEAHVVKNKGYFLFKPEIHNLINISPCLSGCPASRPWKPSHAETQGMRPATPVVCLRPERGYSATFYDKNPDRWDKTLREQFGSKYDLNSGRNIYQNPASF